LLYSKAAFSRREKTAASWRSQPCNVASSTVSSCIAHCSANGSRSALTSPAGALTCGSPSMRANTAWSCASQAFSQFKAAFCRREKTAASWRSQPCNVASNTASSCLFHSFAASPPGRMPPGQALDILQTVAPARAGRKAKGCEKKRVFVALVPTVSKKITATLIIFEAKGWLQRVK